MQSCHFQYSYHSGEWWLPPSHTSSLVKSSCELRTSRKTVHCTDRLHSASCHHEGDQEQHSETRVSTLLQSKCLQLDTLHINSAAEKNCMLLFCTNYAKASLNTKNWSKQHANTWPTSTKTQTCLQLWFFSLQNLAAPNTKWNLLGTPQHAQHDGNWHRKHPFQ